MITWYLQFHFEWDKLWYRFDMMLFMDGWPLIEATSSFYNIMSFFVVAVTVKPIRVSPVELVDYLLLKTI